MSNNKKDYMFSTIIMGVMTLILTIVFSFIFITITDNVAAAIIETKETEVTESTTYICEPTEPEWMLPREDIELIALVTMAEAEGECEEGKRLVIDTILNRVNSEHWPDTVSEVIWQPDQFTSMWNGRVDRCYVSEDICRLVVEELYLQTNTDVVYFTAGAYGEYGTPMFQVGNHYFCKL